ncbi:MAG: M15 family metallopeptidase [Ilumatobacteraceae bacterium]
MAFARSLPLPRPARSAIICAAMLAVAVSAAAVVVVDGAPPAQGGDGLLLPASASATAESIEPVGDVVTVFERGDLTAALRDRVVAAARSAGAAAGTGRGFTGMMSALRRGDSVLQQARGPGWAFPMAVTAFPPDVVRGLMGRGMAALVGGDLVVMGESSAAFHGVEAGDTIDFGINSAITRFVISAVVPDAEIGGTEVLMTVDQARRLGANADTRVVVMPPFDRFRLQLAFLAYGISNDPLVRVRTTWDDFDPDSTLSLIETKQALGEFDIDYANLTVDGWTQIDPVWRDANLPAERETYPTGIRARCHKVIRDAMFGALNEIATLLPQLVNSRPTGIDVANTNSYGGCSIGQARFSRYGASVGTISRHSWGQAIDMSTVDNCQGCVPQFDCRIVQVFRRYGFSWGGNYLRPDGMHFEWVGEPRHTFQYDSKYCPNPVLPAGTAALAPAGFDPRAELFADDGLIHE